MKKGELTALLVIVVSFLLGLYFYPILPDQIASHWNTVGEVDGYMPKFWGAFLMPIISVVLFIVFLVVPKIDPRRANIEKFRNYFDGFIAAIFLFFLYLYVLTLIWNLGYEFNMVQFIVPAIAILFYVIGIVISKAESNWTIGIRTPWTLSSETVWQKTHILGGKLFRGAAIVSFLGIFFPSIAFWILMISIFFAAGYSVLYSYLVYRKEGKA